MQAIEVQESQAKKAAGIQEECIACWYSFRGTLCLGSSFQQAALLWRRYARPPLRQAAPELRRALVEVQCDLDDEADGAPDVRPAWTTCSVT